MRDDIRAAFRSLRASPTFTTVALVVLALGIGAGTAVFSVVDAVVLRGLPFDEHDRLAAALEHDTLRPVTFGDGLTTPQTYLDWRRLQESFDGLAAVAPTTFRLREENGDPASARGSLVSHELFATLRVAPMLGRPFSPGDEVEGRHRAVILSHGFWQRRFGGDAAAVGSTIELNEERYEIVGVMPRDFSYPVASSRPSELFAPMGLRAEDRERNDNRNFNWLAIGRLKPGVSMASAQEQMNAVAAALDERYPKWAPGRRIRVASLHHHLVGGVRGWMQMLLGAVLLVLLIACANVANLMLARAMAKAREIGVRAALGASRWRLVRAQLAEGLVLSLAGAALGVALAFIGVDVIRAWMPAAVPRVAGIAIDMRVLAAAVAAAVATGLGFSIVPAIYASRPNLTACLRDGGRTTTAGRPTQWLRSALVVTEVALAVVLLVGAGLFIASFARVMRVDLGMDYRNVIVLNVFMRHPSIAEAIKQGNGYTARMLDAVRTVPGVAMAEAASGGTPLGGGWSRTPIAVSGVKHEGDNSVDRRAITSQYLQLLRIPLKRGRYFTDSDREGSPLVMIVNETAARKYWPDQDPLGQRATFNNLERTVVGVVGDIRHLGPEEPARPEAYAPFFQERNAGANLVIRTDIDALAALPAVKAAIWSVNREQRLTSEAPTLELQMERLIAQRRFNMALLTGFGLLGLIIAAVGIYGVMSYIVAQRTSEIGVRMALGATRSTVIRMVISRAAVLLVAGLVLGVMVAWPASRLMAVGTFLFHIEATSGMVYGVAIAVLALTGLAASAIPAHRAASVNPLVALRSD